MDPQQLEELKRDGIVQQRQKDTFILRLRLVAGDIDADLLSKVAEVAQRFGRGEVHLTTRQSLEIPWIDGAHLLEAKAALLEVGACLGVCGPRVRGVVGCPGSAVCRFGLVDTKALARALDAAHFGQELPHKFKFAVTGCAHNCAKAQENDVGLMGTVEEGRRGLVVWVGGTLGKAPQLGRRLPGVHDEAGALAVVESILGFFQLHGRPKERLARTLDRVGWEALKNHLGHTSQATG